MHSPAGLWIWFQRLLGMVIVVTTLGACSSGEAERASDFCATWENRTRSCGILGNGRTNCRNLHDAIEPCETRCIAQSTCEELAKYACGNGGNSEVCMDQCYGLEPFTCADGEVIAGSLRCNASWDCVGSGGDDEQGCDASRLYARKCRTVNEWVEVVRFCDGTPDCSDGSDEPAECTLMFQCETSTGEVVDVLQYEFCDGLTLCADGSDEPVDCAVRKCPAK